MSIVMAATQDIRAWLKDNGYNVRPKGRIPADLLAIYQARMKKRVNNRTTGDHNDESDTDSGGPSKQKVKRTSCGFCTVQAAHQHTYCPGTINQGKMGIWTCLCYEMDHVLHM